MKHFVQLDSNIVTAHLQAMDAPPAEACPPGRTFVEVTEQEYAAIDGGDTFDPLVMQSRIDFPKSHRNMNGFTKAPKAAPAESVTQKLDRILDAVNANK